MNREVVLQQQIAEKSTQVEALRAEIVELNKELKLIAQERRNKGVSGDSKMCGKKRERSTNP